MKPQVLFRLLGITVLVFVVLAVGTPTMAFQSGMGSTVVNGGQQVPGTSYTIYLPLIQVPTPLGIYGKVTQGGIPASGIPLYLEFFNGASWSTYTTTSTGADGRYSFIGVPGLVGGQIYYVLYQNPGGTYDGRLWWWATRDLTSYTAGSSVAIGDFDVMDIAQVSPAPGATVPIPSTFTWMIRPITSDNYRFYLMDPAHVRPTYYWPNLGYVTSKYITSLPPEYQVTSTKFGWYPGATSPDGGLGISHYYNPVYFSSTGASVRGGSVPQWEAMTGDKLRLPNLAR